MVSKEMMMSQNTKQKINCILKYTVYKKQKTHKKQPLNIIIAIKSIKYNSYLYALQREQTV